MYWLFCTNCCFGTDLLWCGDMVWFISDDVHTDFYLCSLLLICTLAMRCLLCTDYDCVLIACVLLICCCGQDLLHSCVLRQHIWQGQIGRWHATDLVTLRVRFLRSCHSAGEISEVLSYCRWDFWGLVTVQVRFPAVIGTTTLDIDGWRLTWLMYIVFVQVGFPCMIGMVTIAMIYLLTLNAAIWQAWPP